MKLRMLAVGGLAAVVLLTIAAAPGAAPKADPSTPEGAAEQICSTLQTQMGSMFIPTFGSVAACQSRAADVVRSALASCKAGDQACVQAAIQSGVAALASGGPTGSSGPIADLVATDVCSQLKAGLGEYFAVKFGTDAECKAKIMAKVTALVESATASCRGATDPQGCASSAAKSGETQMRAELEIVSSDELAAEIADITCTTTKTKLGDRFEALLGSLDACKAKVLPTAKQIAEEAAAECKGANDKGACYAKKLNASTAALEAAVGAADAATLATTIAAEACRTAKDELGARFERLLTSMEACQAKILPQARTFADGMLSACKDAADKAACYRERSESAAEGLHAALGAPDAASIGAEIAAEACRTAKEQLGDELFAQQLGSIDACKTRLADSARTLADGAVASCKSAGDKETCFRNKIESGADGLTASLGALDAAGLSTQVAEQACMRAKDALGASFASKLGSIDACKSKIKAAADELAQLAVATCKDAKDKSTCYRQAVETGASSLQAALGGAAGGPSAEEIGDQIAEAACEAAKSQLGSAFASRLGSVAACKAKVKVVAANAAKDAITACKGAKDIEGCIRQATQTSATSLQATLTAGAGPSADEIAGDIAQAACQGARETMGATAFAKKFGTLDACAAKVKAQALTLAKTALAGCAKSKDVEGCVRQNLTAAATGLQATLGAGATPTVAELADEITDEACQGAKDKLGATKFASQFGTFDACKKKIATQAQTLAKSAISACGSVKDVATCIRQKIESGGASLQAALNEAATGGVYIVAAGQTGSLSGAGTYTYLAPAFDRAKSNHYGNTAKLLGEVYIGDGGATATYVIPTLSPTPQKFSLWINYSDDARHPSGTRNVLISIPKLGWSTEWSHVSRNTNGWAAEKVGTITTTGGFTIVFKKVKTTSAAFVMNAFALTTSSSKPGF